MMVNKNLTIYEAFLNSANENLHRTALIYEHKKFSYAHVLNKVNILADQLIKLGYKRDDVITVMLPNIPSAVYLLYAINQIGAIANLIHPLMEYTQLKEIMIKTKSKILFTLDSRINKFIQLKNLGITLYSCSPVDELPLYKKIIYKRINKINVTENKISSLYNGSPYTEYDRSYLKDGFYLHSGGTTGEAKTIALSSFALNSLSVSGLKILDIQDGHGMGMLSVLPMFHGFGLCMGIHVSLIFGAFNVLIPKFHCKKVISYLRRNQIHTLIGVPILYEALLRNKSFNGRTISHVLNAFVGGDFCSDSLKERFNDRMQKAHAKARLFEGYGLTETVTVCSVNTFPSNKNGSVGKPLPYVDIKAFDNNHYPLPPNKEGELYVSGDTLMNGYRFENVISNPFYIDSNRVKWVKTGDYGKVDEDGFVYFVSRKKRIIKVSGINVFPGMIENEIMTLPYIFDCYVKGVQDIKHGNMLKLYVVLDKEYKGRNFNSDINNIIIQKFGIYAIPKEIIYLDKFPKTLVGKTDESKLPE